VVRVVSPTPVTGVRLELPNIGFPPVVLLLASQQSQQSQLRAFVAVMIFGLVIGVFGHIVRSRTLIVTGILIIGLTAAYFAWIVQPH
jgi:hypothetical protein